MNRYSYAELRKKALSENATQKDLEALATWIMLFAPDAWNGFYYDLDDGYVLTPFYKLGEDGEIDHVEYSIW